MADRTTNTYEGEPLQPQASQAFSTRKLTAEPPRVDELIVSLANARENRRARQVVEWEKLYQAHRAST